MGRHRSRVHRGRRLSHQQGQPRRKPGKCHNILPGILRIESRCTECEKHCLTHGVARAKYEGVAFGGKLPDEKTFAGSWEEWAALVAEARKKWEDKILKRRDRARW